MPLRKLLSALALFALAAAGATAAYGVSSSGSATPVLDIEIAIDTTEAGALTVEPRHLLDD